LHRLKLVESHPKGGRWRDNEQRDCRCFPWIACKRGQSPQLGHPFG
jgi:hypothetical protein